LVKNKYYLEILLIIIKKKIKIAIMLHTTILKNLEAYLKIVM